MTLLSRFFGRQETPDATARLVANPAIKRPLSLQVLFAADRLAIDIGMLTHALRSLGQETDTARCEVEFPDTQLLGLVGWADHVVRLVGFSAPFPPASVEQCVAPAHFPGEVKTAIRASASHVLLYYSGYASDPLDQYTALAAVAAALCGFGATGVLNEDAHTALPAAIFTDEDMRGNAWELLHTLPLLALYCGFVKYDQEDSAQVWLRTFGAEHFGLPNFAALAEGHHEGERYFGLFGNILDYLRESGASMAAGHTMQVGEETFMQLRAPTEAEPWLRDDTGVLVAELIGADAINRPH